MSPVTAAPLRILLSEQTLARHGAAAARVLGARSHEFVTIESAVTGEHEDIDIAFISRDVTGLSTKHELAPALRACYDVLRRSAQLRWVHIHSAGADRDIFVELRARGVSVTTSSGANAEVVAQTALAGLLALARRFPQLMAAQREHRWAPLIGTQLPRDLGSQTAVLVGWGPIGQHIGAVLRLLGLRLIVVRTQAQPPQDGIEFVGFDEMTTVLPHADWLLLACPLTTQTRGLVNTHTLALLPRGASLVNVARGEVVVETDLVEALTSGKLGGAFLDVYEHEPLPAASPLWDLPNVIATPHSAGHSDGTGARVAAMFLDNLGRWCAGQALHNLAR